MDQMIQDIFPSCYQVAYQPRPPKPEDKCFFFRGRTVLERWDGEALVLPDYAAVAAHITPKAAAQTAAPRSGSFAIPGLRRSAITPSAAALTIWPTEKLRGIPHAPQAPDTGMERRMLPATQAQLTTIGSRVRLKA